jgi:predicted nucleic acid-binding protein
MNAVDTNVFVYALDADEPDKQAQAIELIDRLSAAPSETMLLWQVAGEFLSCLRRWEAAGRIATVDVEANLVDLLDAFPRVLPVSAVLARSLDLSRRFSLSHGTACCSPLARSQVWSRCTARTWTTVRRMVP